MTVICKIFMFIAFILSVNGLYISKDVKRDEGLLTISKPKENKPVNQPMHWNDGSKFGLASENLTTFLNQTLLKNKKKRVTSGGSRLRRSNEAANSTDLHLLIQSSEKHHESRHREQRSRELQCMAIPPLDQNPLMCYQCQSSFNDKDPTCDHTLWRFIRKSEKFKLRVRCPNGKGNYCVKKVQNRRGEQITERGCFGAGPVAGKDGSLVELQAGCVTYRQNGFLTTTCFCQENLCNFGNRLMAFKFEQFGKVRAGLALTAILFALRIFCIH